MQVGITTRNGTYTLDLIAVRELQKAKHAADAESIFNRFASNVPRADRQEVWNKCDEVA